LYWFCNIGSTSWSTAADSFYAIWKEGGGVLPPNADCESTTLDKAGTAAWILNFVSKVEDLVGKYCSVYTSPGWWNGKVATNSWAKDRKLFNAHWTAAEAPTIPYDWSKYGKTWWAWQWSADGNGLGTYYGAPPPPAADYDMDLDRYNGTLAQFQAEFPVPPPPGPTLEEKVQILWDAHPELH
jgi:hypothetical protein